MLFVYSETEAVESASYLAIITSDGRILWEFRDLADVQVHFAAVGATLGPRCIGTVLPIFRVLMPNHRANSLQQLRPSRGKRLLP